MGATPLKAESPPAALPAVDDSVSHAEAAVTLAAFACGLSPVAAPPSHTSPPLPPLLAANGLLTLSCAAQAQEQLAGGMPSLAVGGSVPHLVAGGVLAGSADGRWGGQVPKKVRMPLSGRVAS